MKRRNFIQNTALMGAALLYNPSHLFAMGDDFPVVRTPLAQRKFVSKTVEEAIKAFKAGVADKEQGWLFENCFPNTLDTTVFHSTINKRPDTYVITGDIDAMWLRDSCAQVWPYIPFIHKDEKLANLIAGVVNRQTQFIIEDPYANAFYKDVTMVSEWKTDLTDMKPGIHERKWEIDSLCYPIRLAYAYWKKTKHKEPFDANWITAIKLTLQTFKEQQRKTDRGPYRFQRETAKPTDSLPMDGYGFPVKPTGLICSMFRPSDDATIYPYLIPSNFFAVTSLKQAAEMVTALTSETALSKELLALATEVESALKQHATYKHPEFGEIYAFEVDGYGNHNLMDDANIPSLLALPYLDAMPVSDPVYQNTRRFCLSQSNPFFYKGEKFEGIGGPHVGKADMIWPLSIIARGLTSTDQQEIKHCLKMLKASHAGTGFMHESFQKDDPSKFTRSWFAWANTIYGEFLWKVFKETPQLLA